MIVKLAIDQQKFDDPAKKVNRYLVVVKSNGLVKDGYLYDVFGDAAQIGQNTDEYITHYNKNFDIPFTGNLSKLTLKQGFKESSEYNEGNLKKRMILISRKHKSEQIIQSIKKPNGEDPVCLDFYMQYFYDGSISEHYLYTICSCDGPPQSDAVRDRMGVMSIFLKPSCSGSGDYLPPPPDSVYKWTFCNNLTTTQKAAINNSINTFSTSVDCPSKFLYNYLINTLNMKYSFCIGASSTPNYSFNYNPNTKAFTYATNAMTDPVMSYGLEHEFFHALQDVEVGISGYGKDATTGINSPGFVNIEFEQAVFNDIANGSYQAFNNGTQTQQNAYKTWIDGLTNNGTTYPQIDSSNTTAYNNFITQYNSFLSNYNQIPGNVNSSNIINLLPSTLIFLYNHTTPNC